MFDDEFPDGRNKLFFCQSLSGLFTQKPAHHLKPTHTRYQHPPADIWCITHTKLFQQLRSLVRTCGMFARTLTCIHTVFASFSNVIYYVLFKLSLSPYKDKNISSVQKGYLNLNALGNRGRP